jgi:hypothetical protein
MACAKGMLKKKIFNQGNLRLKVALIIFKANSPK